jgi:hypothetical protein
MSRNIIFVLRYHRHKLSDLIYDRSCLHFIYNWQYNCREASRVTPRSARQKMRMKLLIYLSKLFIYSFIYLIMVCFHYNNIMLNYPSSYVYTNDNVSESGSASVIRYKWGNGSCSVGLRADLVHFAFSNGIS